VAKEVIPLVGVRTMPIDEFKALMALYSGKPGRVSFTSTEEQAPKLKSAFKSRKPLFDVMSTYPSSKPDLLKLLHKFRSFNATDPRDKIYALLCISADADAGILRPDYSLGVDEVYHGFAKYAIEMYGNISVLSYVSPWKTLESPTIPSWCPDWRTKTLQKFVGKPKPKCQPPLSVNWSVQVRDINLDGIDIAHVSSVFRDGSNETKPALSFRSSENTAKQWPYASISQYLTNSFSNTEKGLESSLKVDDVLCFFKNTSGLAVLRPDNPGHSRFSLVSLAHSQFSAFDLWTSSSVEMLKEDKLVQEILASCIACRDGENPCRPFLIV
jgi:hypothetical protein